MSDRLKWMRQESKRQHRNSQVEEIKVEEMENEKRKSGNSCRPEDVVTPAFSDNTGRQSLV